MTTLSLELRDVLRLIYWENLTQLEVATRLGIPVGTVASRLHRAKQVLKRAMAELAEIGNARDFAQKRPRIARA